jgi:transcriptional regulator GlxA family with amidase domain
VFLLVPRLHLLDLAGPAQAFATAADFGCGYELSYFGEQEDVPTAQGSPSAPSPAGRRSAVTTSSSSPAGGPPLPWQAPARSPRPRWPRSPPITRTAAVASVCAGTDALGRAGLLDGRRCTTHHDIQDELARRYPRACVVRDVLYVIDGRVATSAGIASGIDLALHLIAVRDGAAMAAKAARQMVVYARRNGDERQASAMLRHRNHQQELRVERAEHLIGHGTAVEAAAQAVGFTDGRMLRRLRAREAAA